MMDYFSNRKKGKGGNDYQPSKEELDFLSFVLLKPGIIFQAKQVSIPNQESDTTVDSESEMETKLVSDISVSELMKQFEEKMKGIISSIVKDEVKEEEKKTKKEKTEPNKSQTFVEFFSTKMGDMSNVMNRAEEIRNETMMTPEELAEASGMSVGEAKEMIEKSGVTESMFKGFREDEAQEFMQNEAARITQETKDYFKESSSPKEKDGLTVEEKNVPDVDEIADDLNIQTGTAPMQQGETNIPSDAAQQLGENTVLQNEDPTDRPVLPEQKQKPSQTTNSQHEQTKHRLPHPERGGEGISKGLGYLRGSAQMPIWRSTLG